MTLNKKIFHAKQKSASYLSKNRQKSGYFFLICFFYASIFLCLFLLLLFSLSLFPLSFSLSIFCNHPFRAYKRILLCVVNIFSSPVPMSEMENGSKKGLGRNGGALCPEFVPHRSPCSFTRDDKSGVALTLYPHPSSHPPWPFSYRPAASILAYTQNYRDRT